MIRLTHATVVIDEITLLEPTTLEVATGEAVAIRGPNGAGKTTLLRLLAGLVAATDGEVTVAGMDPDQRLPEFRQALAAFIDPWPVARELTVHEHLALIALSWGIVDADAHADALLDEFGIGMLARRFPHELSSGQRQLWSLAMTCARPAQVLLLDEPEQRLDPDRLSAVIASFRRRVDAGVTLLVATHSPRLATELCDREQVVRMTPIA